MTRWILLASLALPGGVLFVVAAIAWHRHVQRRRFEAQSWPDQIASLKTDTPMALPAVRPLKAESTSRRYDRIDRFQQRMKG